MIRKSDSGKWIPTAELGMLIPGSSGIAVAEARTKIPRFARDDNSFCSGRQVVSADGKSFWRMTAYFGGRQLVASAFGYLPVRLPLRLFFTLRSI
jgi:hypothetical protein